MAKLIKTDGTSSTVTPKNKEEGFSLEECYELIGCRVIEVIEISDGLYMIIDEEGKLKADMQLNACATMLYSVTNNVNDCIVGNAILCNNNEIH